MRFIVTGLLLLLIPTAVFAQVKGQVESIGFDDRYRPDCWTPMRVRLTPNGTDTADYVIAVYQHDLDGDRPIYTRSIVLNGGSGANKGEDQRFWVYFLPQPIQKGLPDKVDSNLHTLERDLQVYLCKPGNPPKPIVQLPLTSQLQNIDPFRESYGSKPRSTKLILSVSQHAARPTLNISDDYNKTYGALQDVEVVSLRQDELPEDPIGYDAVDAIIWLDGDPSSLKAGTLNTFGALSDYVRYGGRLVICQSTADWREDQAFGELLPVDITGMADRTDFEPLDGLANPRSGIDPLHPKGSPWAVPTTQPLYQMGRAIARPGAVVDKWIEWKNKDGTFKDATPYLARKAYGLGEVVWVAQQLTAGVAPENPVGWPYVWNRVMGWRSDAYSVASDARTDDPNLNRQIKPYGSGGPADLGYSLTRGLDLSSKANWLILLAVFFFIAYWLTAGPGSYLYLVTKKRQAMSWFIFGVAALAATGVTVILVKLVLRGPPEIRHLSFVRVAPGQPAIVHSRFGLYIPRDGSQKIALSDTSPSSVSYLSPYAEHPQQLGGDASEFPSPTDYYVPVRDLKSDPKSENPPELNVDYRSSSKKFQARWVGEWQNRIIGSVRLNPDDHSLHLAGSLTNSTGADLKDIFLAFNGPQDKDYMIYVPDWKNGTTYDIARDFAKPLFAGKGPWVGGTQLEAAPGEKKIICDEIAPAFSTTGWANLWHNHFRRSGADDPNISDTDMTYIYPLLSVFDRVPAMPNVLLTSAGYQREWSNDRVDFYNRGARMINASPSISSGQLLILASTTDSPIPIPLEVDDSKMKGQGSVFYQFVLPIDRGKMDAPATQPVK